MKTLKFAVVSMFVASLLSCETTDENINPDPNAAKGTVKVGITDAPIDDKSISGAFVTITEVKINGKTYEGFDGPKTVNLLSLQNGNSLTLGEGQFEAGTISKIALVLDYEKDQNGASPGCYVQKTDGTKETLAVSGNAKNEIEIATKRYDLAENQTLDLMIDFDLRKSIKENNPNAATKDYAFVTYGELQSSIRIVDKAQTGEIAGKLSNYNASTNGDVVVFVYKKGEFNKNKETDGQGTSDITYKNAVTSAKLDGSGNFKVAFLEAGEYELHFASNKSTGIGFSTLLDITSVTDLSAVKVQSNAQVNLSLSLKGILPI